MRRSTRGALAALAIGCSAAGAWATDLAPPVGAGAEPAPPWRVVGLPNQSKPFTRFSVVELDGHRVLRVESDRAYGNLLHPLSGTAPGHLSWRWRVDQPVQHADLYKRSGEDAALKVCASFDLPAERVPFLERQWVALMQLRSAEKFPLATLCYVWDTTLPDNTLVVSPFTHRIRSITQHGSGLGQWTSATHDLAADFLRAFGDESRSVPSLVGILVGADADNTASHSVGYVSDLVLDGAH